MRHFLLALIVAFIACRETADQSDATALAPAAEESQRDYLNYTSADDQWSGGVRVIPIETPKGTFKVWTKRVGNSPRMKLLLLHGGPGMTHEYFGCFDTHLPYAGIEYYYYDQLESAYSDQPNDPDLWTIDRYVDEVEQVRQALHLDSSNFYLLGHSWGGILGIEYALKHQEHLKGLIISNMMASVPAYNAYADSVLGPMLDPTVLRDIQALEKSGDYGNPRYLELITTHYYPEHVLRRPLGEWPEPVNRSFGKAATGLYVAMQGPSEFGIRGEARLLGWDRFEDLRRITVPTLTIGGAHDTMDPKHMEAMAEVLPKGSYLHCPQGSHMSMYDDQATYFAGLIEWMREVDEG